MFVIPFGGGTRRFTAAVMADADLRVEIKLGLAGTSAATAIPRVTGDIWFVLTRFSEATGCVARCGGLYSSGSWLVWPLHSI